MTKSTWQKARHLKYGLELWLKIEKPGGQLGFVPGADGIYAIEHAVTTNILFGDHECIAPAHDWELLARDEHDFTDNPPILSWIEWKQMTS